MLPPKRRASKRAKTLPEELFGPAWARRLRIGIPLVALLDFVAGCLVFALWSQTVGRFVLGLGVGLGIMWFGLRRGDPAGALASLRRVRPQLVVCGAILVAAGLATFAVADQDVGLLLVVLGGLALMVTLFGTEQEPLASPMDGPFYGDTPPYGD
jgi:hypothetical protein